MSEEDIIPKGEEINPLEKIATKKHDELTQIAELSANSIAIITKLLYVTPSTYRHFDNIEKVALEGCTTFEIANALIDEINEASKLLLKNIPDMTSNEDNSIRQELNNSLITSTKSCSDNAKSCSDKLKDVRVLIHKFLMDDFIENGPFEGDFLPIADVLSGAVTQLGILQDKWIQFSDFMSTITSNLKIFAESLAANARDVEETIQQLPMSGIRVSALAEAYTTVAEKYLKNRVKELRELLQKPAESKEALSKLAEAGEQDISEIQKILATNREEFLGKLRDGIALLSDKGLDVLVRNEQANDMEVIHRKLEKKLIAAPRSIALLAKLCILSSTTADFQLCPPQHGFQHAKSTSFRATLHQVVNRGSDSFALANKNLGRIELLTKEIPDTVMTILELILGKNPDDIENELPGILESVVEKMKKCNKLSTEVDKFFEAMVDLINELTVSFTANRSELHKSMAHKDVKDEDKNILMQKMMNTHQVLMKGAEQLSGVRAQWMELIQFFNQLSNKIQIEMNEPLEAYRKRVEVKVKRIAKTKKAELSQYVTETLQKNAKDIAEKGFEVNMLAGTYLQISKQYLHTPLLSLDELLTITDSTKLDPILNTITTNCETAQKDIETLAEQNREEGLKKFRKRLLEIEQAIQQAAGEVDDEAEEEDDEEDGASTGGDAASTGGDNASTGGDD